MNDLSNNRRDEEFHTMRPPRADRKSTVHAIGVSRWRALEAQDAAAALQKARLANKAAFIP